MTRVVAGIGNIITAMAFVVSLAAPAATYAVTPAPLELKVRVSEKGFADEKGVPYTAKRMLKVPQGALVKITFVFSEDMNSLAVGDTHQIALRSEAGAAGEAEQISVMNRQSSVTFHAGEKGQTQYRAYCILDCIGMEHLTNLLIQVVSA